LTPLRSPQTKLKTVILVVDDDDWVLTTTVRMIETLGFEAVPAASGAAALRLIDSGVEVGLVLADFAMPGMTGVELAKTIHAEHPDLPVIIVTGYGDHAVLRDCGEAILQKPFAENELNKKIAAALR
jgi:FixJ family two-component response regulator